MESVKERIQKLCKLRGISLHKLEVDLGFGNSTIRKWDKNQPRIDKLQAVADYFGVDVSEIAIYNISGQNDGIKEQNDGIDDFGFAMYNYSRGRRFEPDYLHQRKLPELLRSSKRSGFSFAISRYAKMS